MTDLQSSQLDSIFDGRASTIARDLTLNLKRVLGESALDPTEAALALLATTVSCDDRALSTLAREWLTHLGVSADEILEASESAAMMKMLNTYYRFRHTLKEGQGEAVESALGPASLRMTALAKPKLGKERFEMLALAVSVLNGCSTCINAHEQVLRTGGVDVKKIHDLARLASVVAALQTLARA